VAVSVGVDAPTGLVVAVTTVTTTVVAVIAWRAPERQPDPIYRAGVAAGRDAAPRGPCRWRCCLRQARTPADGLPSTWPTPPSSPARYSWPFTPGAAVAPMWIGCGSS